MVAAVLVWGKVHPLAGRYEGEAGGSLVLEALPPGGMFLPAPERNVIAIATVDRHTWSATLTGMMPALRCPISPEICAPASWSRS